MTSDVVAAVREVAASIFAAADMSGDGFDAASWRRLEDAGFTRPTVPENAGGGGAGLDVAAAVLFEAGAHLQSKGSCGDPISRLRYQGEDAFRPPLQAPLRRAFESLVLLKPNCIV